jgi:hypothetical protein
MADQLDNSQIPDLSHLREQVERVLRQFMPEWSKMRAAMRDDLLDQVSTAIANDDFAALLSLVPDTSDAADALYEHLRDIADWSASQTVQEMDADDDAPDGVGALTPSHDQLHHLAIVTVGLLAVELGVSAARATMAANGSGQGRDEVVDSVGKYLDGLSTAGAETQFGGALHGTLNASRLLTFSSAPVGSLYASELNDANTCEPCRHVNGRFLGTTEQLDQVARSYPQGAYGGYIHCQGGPRCRGTIFGVWRSAQVEET